MSGTMQLHAVNNSVNEYGLNSKSSFFPNRLFVLCHVRLTIQVGAISKFVFGIRFHARHVDPFLARYKMPRNPRNEFARTRSIAVLKRNKVRAISEKRSVQVRVACTVHLYKSLPTQDHVVN